jgi:hypothetical protein
MRDSPETPSGSRQPRPELEDGHYHDEDEAIVSDDGHPRTSRVVGKRKPIRRPPPRRPAHDDD